MSASKVKNPLHEQFARIGNALDSPRRVELLELHDQGERSVETLSKLTGMGLTNTSAHLQVLRQSRLVETRKDGTKWPTTRWPGSSASSANWPAPASPIPGALSIPFDELEHRLDSIPANVEIIAYCRGPYCVLAPSRPVATRTRRTRPRPGRRLPRMVLARANTAASLEVR
jgi:DNA-binding transcriptional ArsR family regulator